MSCVQLSEGGFQVVYPLGLYVCMYDYIAVSTRTLTPPTTGTACGPGHPELSKSYMDMASKLFTFTFTLTSVIGLCTDGPCSMAYIAQLRGTHGLHQLCGYKKWTGKSTKVGTHTSLQ